MLFLLMSAVLTLYIGDAKVKRGGEIFDAFVNMELYSGDTVVTGDSSKVEIMEKDSSLITLGENTTFTILEEEKKRSFFLSIGKIWAKVKKLAGWDFTVDSPITAAGVRGTEFYMTVEPESSQVAVVEGKVDVLDKKENKHYMIEKMKKYRRARRRVIIERIKERRIKRWAEWNRKDLERLIKLSERGKPGAVDALSVLSKRLGIDLQKSIEEIRKKQEKSGIKNKNLLMKVKVKQLKAEIILIERKIKDIEKGLNGLKSLLKARRYKMARVLALQIEGKITRNRAHAGNLKNRADILQRELRNMLKKTGTIKNEEIRNRYRKEIVKDLKNLGLLKERVNIALKKLNSLNRMFIRLKKQLKP